MKELEDAIRPRPMGLFTLNSIYIDGRYKIQKDSELAINVDTKRIEIGDNHVTHRVLECRGNAMDTYHEIEVIHIVTNIISTITLQ